MSIIEGQEYSENPEKSTAIEQTDDEAFLQWERENWLKDFPKRPAPDHNSHYQFQKEYCGETEIEVQGGDEKIWADGIDVETGAILEAKYIKDPAKSPYISTSECPSFIRAKAVIVDRWFPSSKTCSVCGHRRYADYRKGLSLSTLWSSYGQGFECVN